MRAVDYRRVSSEMQLDNFSLDAQADANARLIQARGWSHVGSYVDEAISARTTDRPAFQQMLADARAGAFDVIVVQKLDRFSRSLADMLLTMRELERIGVTVASASEDFDFTTPIGRVLLAMLAAFAQWYLDNLSAETSKGKKAMAQAGHWQGRLPFGYSAHYKQDGGDALALPDENADGVRLAFRLAAGGEHSYRQIGDALNAAGYRPTGRAGKRSLSLWSTDSVRMMIRNRFYLGEVSHRGEWYEGLHEPLVTREQFDQAQEAMRGRARVSAFKANRETRLYLLSGLGRCGECGSPLRAEYHDNNEAGEARRIYQYYRCSSRFRGVPCESSPYVRVEWLDDQVAERLTGLSFPGDWAEYVREHARRLVEAETPKSAVVEGRRLKAQLGRLRDLYELGDVERDEYLARRDRLQEQLAALPASRSARQVQRVATRLATLADVWRIATPEERRGLVREIVQRVIVHPDRSVEIRFRPGYRPFFAP